MNEIPKAKVFITLFLLGLPGVLSLLLLPLPIPPGEELPVSSIVLQVAALVQSGVLLAIATAVGTRLAPRVGLSSPLMQALYQKAPFQKTVLPEVLPGLIGGGLAFVIIMGLQLLATPHLPAEYIALNQETGAIPAPVRFLYGGITEELLMRWGLMTFFVWLFWRLVQRRNGSPKSRYVWLAIATVAVLFGVGHLPLLMTLVAQPGIGLIAYIVTLNLIFGLVAGWLYWRKGLESAMIAHLTFHALVLALSGLV